MRVCKHSCDILHLPDCILRHILQQQLSSFSCLHGLNLTLGLAAFLKVIQTLECLKFSKISSLDEAMSPWKHLLYCLLSTCYLSEPTAS